MAIEDIGSKSSGENISQDNPQRKRVKEIIAYHLGLCKRVGMNPDDPDSLINVDIDLWNEKILERGQTFEEVYPDALDEVLNPSESEPIAEVIRLRDRQSTTPPPRHSSSE